MAGRRTHRRVFFMYSLIIGSIFFGSSFVQADDFDPEKFNPAQFEEYERQLNAILKTRRDEEKEFVAQVVAQVRIGKTPAKLVQTSYQWVRNKRPDTDYPFIYFEKVLRLQAIAIKVQAEVPAFDYSIYGSAGQRSIGQQLNAGQRTGLQESSMIRSASGKSVGQIK